MINYSFGQSNKIKFNILSNGMEHHKYIFIYKKQTGSSLFACQFCPSDPNIIMTAGGNQMKLFSLKDHN